MEKVKDMRPLLPNVVTMMALAFGVSSLNMAFWGHWSMAVFFIFLAAILDFMDGKVARLLGVASKFGAELDSLSDFVSFGVAPAFVMYMWTMDQSMRIEVLQANAFRGDAIGIPWALVLFVAMCCAMRLARFNTLLDDETVPPYWKKFFMGVPAPAGAGLVLLPLIYWLSFKGEVGFFRSVPFVAFFMLFAGIMMASRIPTLCLKHIHFSEDALVIVRIFLLLGIAALIGFPWLFLSFVGTVYLICIPLVIMSFLKEKARHSRTK